MKNIFTIRTRKLVYALSVALQPILLTWHLTTGERWTMITAAVDAVFAAVLAYVNVTPTEEDKPL